MKHLLLALFFIPLLSFSQNKKQKKALEAQQKADQLVITNLQNHTASLLQASANASANENIVSYLSSQFKTSGLLPKGNNGYVQTFVVDDGKQVDPKTSLKINGSQLALNKEHFPLAYSASKAVTGMPAMALREKGAPWFKDVKDWFNENAVTADFTIDKAIQKEAAKASTKGATALFLFNSSSDADGVTFNKNDKTAPLAIPVIYIRQEGYKKYFSDASQMLDIELNTAIKESTRTLHNVVGLLENDASTAVVISSVVHTAVSSAVKGDIAGIATLLELAKMLAATKAKNNNYLFMVSVGENEEVAGAKYWLTNPTVTTPINYCICLDNLSTVGATNKLVVNGTQSSPVWNDIITSISQDGLAVETGTSEMKDGNSGIFYQKNIPLLLLSAGSAASTTGTTASDENYKTQVNEAKLVCKLIETADSKGKVLFSKSLNAATPAIDTRPAAKPVMSATPTTISTLPKAEVSLGVIPDKSNDGLGLRIISVSHNKLAEKLGLQKGDMLTDLGAHKITDIQTYLMALARFKPGDKAVLKIKRGKEDKEFAVEF